MLADLMSKIEFPCLLIWISWIISEAKYVSKLLVAPCKVAVCWLIKLFAY